MLDENGEWAVSISETQAFVMIRNPIEEDALGVWYIDELACRWVQVPYQDANVCTHQGALCRDCQELWFDDYHIQLRSSDGEYVLDFDALVRAELDKQGIPLPSLEQYLELYFGVV